MDISIPTIQPINKTVKTLINYSAPININKQKKLSILEKNIIWQLIKLRIFFIACNRLRSIKNIIATYKHLLQLRKQTWAGNMKKMYKLDGKYYFNLYTPGWPSKAYDELIKRELQRFAAPVNTVDKMTLIFLAVTRKCPLRCEHCFEWDNLNQPETFTKEELIQIVDLYQKQGVNQIHFSGGEPMVRVKDLIEVIAFAKNKSECYVVTSGFKLTADNAIALKKAGCKGIIVSIDHHLPELHNRFRNHPDIFNKAVAGVHASLNAGLITAVSVCATKEFIDGNHLLPYFNFANNLGVHFVQVLEPKAVGNYSGKDVILEEKHIQQLEDFFTLVNRAPQYKNHPTLMYHGYHQRRVGCYAGSRSVYIDSAGDVHACPFCHTKSYNIKAVLKATNKQIPIKENACPRYGKIA